MSKRRHLPVALTIAGSDSGGGAGIQADLKTFAALGVHGTSTITCVTAQNPKQILGLHPCPPSILRQQLDAIFAELPPAAVKTGMLFSTEIIQVVIDFFKRGRRPPLIVDPVMVATSGARLLQASAVRALTRQLLPRAMLVTPNLPEAAILTGWNLDSVQAVRAAAREIHKRYRCAALVKGGHLGGLHEAVDFFYDGRTELLLKAAWVKGVVTHGTGCAYSAAITAHVALGRSLPKAVELAKEHVTQAIARSYGAGRHTVLNPF